MSEIKVNSIKGVAASTAALTINNTDGTCTANLTNRTNKNLVLNGAFLVAQRGVSSTSTGYNSVDRFPVNFTGTDEAPTQEQADVAAGTTPYSLGFRKCLKITNGNQTSGAGADDYIYTGQKFEAQNIASSGWNYVSASSFITLSFWVKSSVAQKFTGFFYTNQAAAGDSYMYSYQIDNGSGGNLTADTWTKITHSIPGNSNLTLNNDNTRGLAVGFYMFEGTDYSTSSHTENTWAAWNTSNKIKDMTSTWYTTNDATFEITGVQLEVGSVATDFEHRSYAQELDLCQWYYHQVYFYWNTGSTNSNYLYYVGGQFNPIMRAAPSLVAAYDNNNENSFETRDGSTWRTGLPTLIEAQPEGIVLRSNNNVVFNAIKGIAHFNAEL